MDWNRVWVELGGLLWEIVRPILAILLTAIAVQVAAKLGVSLSADRQAALEHDIENAIRRGEELRAAGKLTPHTDILTWVTSEVQRARPKVPREAIEDLVHALLPKLGLGAAAKGVRAAGV